MFLSRSETLDSKGLQPVIFAYQHLQLHLPHNNGDMYLNETNIRVRYAETDQMGYVYYGNYAQYCEVGRVEALRSLGLSYKEMEDDGVMLPVINYNINYMKPALYDDLLTIKTYIKQLPSVRIKFDYEIYNEPGTLLNTGETTLVFVNKTTGRPCQPPADFLEKIKQYFN